MAGLVPATYEHLSRRSVWVAGTSPAMTIEFYGMLIAAIISRINQSTGRAIR